MLQTLCDQQNSQCQIDGIPTEPAVNPKLLLSSINFVNKADPIVIKLKIGPTPVDISIG